MLQPRLHWLFSCRNVRRQGRTCERLTSKWHFLCSGALCGNLTWSYFCHYRVNALFWRTAEIDTVSWNSQRNSGFQTQRRILTQKEELLPCFLMGQCLLPTENRLFQKWRWTIWRRSCTLMFTWVQTRPEPGNFFSRFLPDIFCKNSVWKFPQGSKLSTPKWKFRRDKSTQQNSMSIQKHCGNQLFRWRQKSWHANVPVKAFWQTDGQFLQRHKSNIKCFKTFVKLLRKLFHWWSVNTCFFWRQISTSSEMVASLFCPFSEKLHRTGTAVPGSG